jgi:hypothetical protein
VLPAALAVLVAAASACVGLGKPTAVPLYPGPGNPDRVATLYGPIASVDDKDVSSRGRTFELLPGCHLVTLLRKVGDADGQAAWSGTLPPVVYALWMRPQHQYWIKYEFQSRGGPLGGLSLTAEERSPAGVVKMLGVAGPADVERCREWQRIARDE